jgi:hypothetical protein
MKLSGRGICDKKGARKSIEKQNVYTPTPRPTLKNTVGENFLLRIYY